MVRGNIISILEFLARRDRDQHVIAVARRGNPQAMRVKVGVVEASFFRALLIRASLETVVEINRQRLSRRDSDGRRDKVALVDAAAVKRAQLDRVVGLRPRIVDRAFGTGDVEFVVDIIRARASHQRRRQCTRQ